MILTNCTIADIIYKKYPEKAILRIHDGIDSQRWNNIYDNENLKNLDKDIINSIKILYTNSAKYDITSNIETNKEILHIGLNKKYYTHFTSPIRRYIDIIIHRMLLIDNYNLDAFLSIDNYSALNAAAAHFPALGVPMGYTASGQPKNITFIAPSKNEQLLLELGAAFERLHQPRMLPILFQ